MENDPTTGLPPAGPKRADELSRRLDVLQEKAETAGPEVESIDPKKLRPDRELQHLFDKYDILTITNPQPGYKYCWAYTGLHGNDIWGKKGEGWEVVQGNDPECREHTMKDDTTRRVGDVLLMRIRVDLHVQLLKRAALRQARQEGSIESELFALGQQAKGAIKVFQVNKHPYMQDDAPVSIVMPHRSHPAYNTAMGALNNMLKTGEIPGVAAPGK
jgi:hypothetical protein